VPTDTPITMHCASGWRCTVAASLLRAKGFGTSGVWRSGYNQWSVVHAPA